MEPSLGPDSGTEPTVASLHCETCAATEKLENAMQEPKESVSKSYLDQLTELNQSLADKDKELAELYKVSSKQKYGIEDLNDQLSEANEIISSQETSISELKTLLNEERYQRREEQAKASANLKLSVQRVQAEAVVELKRVMDGALKQEKGQKEIINKLQKVVKERSCVVEKLKTKLENAMQKLLKYDRKVSKLEAQIQEEHLAFVSNRKMIEELDRDRKILSEQLEYEKAAREEAYAKVSALELEISVAMRDLDFERVGVKAARERTVLCETLLRAFYSTTEEISVLFSKQQEQLAYMQKTLKEEENHKNASGGVGPNLHKGNFNQSNVENKEGTISEGFVSAETAPVLEETERLDMESLRQCGNVEEDLRNSFWKKDARFRRGWNRLKEDGEIVGSDEISVLLLKESDM